MKQIIVTISTDGKAKIDVQGLQGVGCAAATEQLELVLGGGTAKKTPKPEYYAPATTGNQLTQRSVF